MNDNEEMRLIVAERGEYVVPVGSSVTWAQCYPDAKPPKGVENHKFGRHQTAG